MQSQGISNALKLNLQHLQTELKLIAGDYLYVNVVKQLYGNKWAISIGGKIYPAVSKTNLTPGERLRVLVQITGQILTLKICTEQKQSLVDVLFEQTGEKDLLTKQIISSLVKSNVNTAPQTIHYLHSLLSKLKKDDTKFIRGLTLLLAKNIEPEWESEGIKKIVDLLHYEDRNFNQQNGKNQKKRALTQLNHEQGQASLKEQVQATSSGDDPLQLFNHLHGSGYSWLVIPYQLDQAEGDCHGTIKILYEPFQQKMIKLLIGIKMEHGEQWYFSLYPQKDKIKLSILCNQPENWARITKEKIILIAKLQKYNVEIDDNINDFTNFDGFGTAENNLTEENEGYYTGVDTTL
jgi:hypothetical protein